MVMEKTYEEGVKIIRESTRYETEDVLNMAIESCFKENGGCRTVLSKFKKEQADGGTNTGTLDKLAKDIGNSAYGDIDVNTFPMGIPTTKVLPEFIGVYYGNNKYQITKNGKVYDHVTLNDVLDAAKKHCKRMVKEPIPYEEDKTILIFTDKWDSYTFQKYYATTFINYAYQHNILFIFLLVNDFGVSRIPFLSWNREIIKADSDFYIISEARAKAIENELVEKVLLRADNYPICHYNKDGVVYEFNLVKRTFSCDWINFENSSIDDKTGMLSDKAIRGFALAVADIVDMPGVNIVQNAHMWGAQLNTAELFGKHFAWYSEILHDHPDEVYAKLEKAFSILLEDVKKN